MGKKKEEKGMEPEEETGKEMEPRKEEKEKELKEPELNALGFQWSDLRSWSSFVKLMHSPRDPSNLGATRMIFGLLMVLDVLEERGLASADYRWGDVEECRFPLFHFLQPLPLAWMYVLYLVMAAGAIGIMLGFLYRLSCLMFLLPYWYIFLLDKTSWNNHSYLYGLCACLLLFCNSNRWGSVDGLVWPSIRNSHVPLWNYALLRTQFFLVYFIAGLKKLDQDWVDGYSMQKLSGHWVFSPFYSFMSKEDIDLWVVHRGGLTIDLSMGFLLLFDLTRPIGVLIAVSFHGMNSQLFSIGMFPYVMLGTLPLFSYVTWPKSCLLALPTPLHRCLPSLDQPSPADNCVYEPEVTKTETRTRAEKDKDRHRKQKSTKHGSKDEQGSGLLDIWHHLTTFLILFYIALQCFLPYSHFITKGYNNWTPGLYGYSWDMMVHTWSTQHIRITYVNADTGDSGYLNPDAWTRSGHRWSSHADMVKQYAVCIKERLGAYNMSNVQLYFDVWRSLNDRFHQRMFDPHTDILTAEWHPLHPTPWLMPLLLHLSDWRTKLDAIELEVYAQSNDTDIVFIADFPGLVLENYIQPELGNASVTVLKGTVIVELPSGNHTLVTGDSMQLPTGEYHSIHTVSVTPSCCMYTYVNTTEVQLSEQISRYEQQLLQAGPAAEELAGDIAGVYQEVKRKQQEIEQVSRQSVLESLSHFLAHKYKRLVRSLSLSKVAIQSIVTRQSFEAVFNATVGQEPHELLEEQQ